ncbi:MAG: M48 family metallopeptidase [Fibromonadales bacterium]|nr:M48 family metallopeptidase [Fibromonadales bacterium]
MSNKWKAFWAISLVFVVLFQACGMHSWEETIISKADEKKMGREYDSLIKIGHKDVMEPGESIFTPDPNNQAQMDFYKFYQERAKEILNVIDPKDLKALLPTGYECDNKRCTKDNFFEFKLIKSKQVNAFAVPGGYVYFYTPILKEFKSESELSCVLAHEVGHIVMHHSRERMVKAAGASIIIDALLGDGIGALLASLGTSVWLMGHSQDNEFEADSLASYYTNKIGISSEGLSDFFARGLKTNAEGICIDSSSSILQVFSTHPPSCKRVNKNKYFIEKYGQTLAKHPRDKHEINGKYYNDLVRAAGF